jgi:hypothetical protein
MKYNYINNCYEELWTNHIIPDCVLRFELVDDEMFPVDKMSILQVGVTIGEQDEDGVYDFQKSCVEYIQGRPHEIRQKTLNACNHIVRAEYPQIYENPVNIEKMANFATNTNDWINSLIELSGITIFNASFKGKCIYALDFNCGWDCEHGLSLLFIENHLMGISGKSDFCHRGDSILAHAEGCIYDSLIERM